MNGSGATLAGEWVSAYEVGTNDGLRARSAVGDALDLPHVGQAYGRGRPRATAARTRIGFAPLNPDMVSPLGEQLVWDQTLGSTESAASGQMRGALSGLEGGNSSPGYGSLKNYIETHTNHLYVGVDVFPRIPGVLETRPDGILAEEFVSREGGTFSYVVATNVFQHLSARQRARYVADAEALLHPNGLFIFNMTVDTGKLPAFMRDRRGDAWADHYGQYTPIPKPGELYEQIAARFDILYVTQRYDALFNFVCQKR